MSLAPSRPIGRFRAAGIHLAISVAVASLVLGAMLLVWYPGPFFTAMGGNNLVMILVGVDVVLGPLMTLIVFNVAKGRWLTFDLAVIGAIQLMALAYGVHIVAEARPVYMVFAVDRFELTAANQIRDEELASVKRPEFRDVPWGSPRTVGARVPVDSSEQFRIVASAASTGNDLSTFPQHFVPYADVAIAGLKRAKPLSELRRKAPDAPQKIDRALAKLGRSEADTLFVPLKGKVKDHAVLLDAKTGAVLGFVEVFPW